MLHFLILLQMLRRGSASVILRLHIRAQLDELRVHGRAINGFAMLARRQMQDG